MPWASRPSTWCSGWRRWWQAPRALPAARFGRREDAPRGARIRAPTRRSLRNDQPPGGRPAPFARAESPALGRETLASATLAAGRALRPGWARRDHAAPRTPPRRTEHDPMSRLDDDPSVGAGGTPDEDAIEDDDELEDEDADEAEDEEAGRDEEERVSGRDSGEVFGVPAAPGGAEHPGHPRDSPPLPPPPRSPSTSTIASRRPSSSASWWSSS